MQIRSLLAVLVGIFAFVAARPLDDEVQYVQDTHEFWKRQDPVKPCASGVHIIAVSGEGKQNEGSTGALNVTYAALKSAVPGSTHRNLPYPKASPNGVAMTVVGSKNMVRWIGEYVDACPDSKLVLVGYSSGGIITMDTLCGASQYPWPSSDPLTSKYEKNIIATIIYGDETFVSGQSYDVGSCTGQGRLPRQNLTGCDTYASTIQSYCVVDDPQCCLGDNGSAHFVYPTLYMDASIRWVQQKYEESK